MITGISIVNNLLVKNRYLKDEYELYDDYDYDPYESYADRYARYYESTKLDKRKPGRPKKGSKYYD